MRGIKVGIDIGTTTITTVVLRREKDGKVRVLGVGTSASAGLRRGAIVNPDETALSLRRSLQAASRSSGIAIKSAVVGIGGSHLGSFTARGVVAISRADGEIMEDDVRRVIQAAEGLVPKNPNREVIHLIPREFKVDSQGGISDPVGMIGMKLEAEALAIDGAKSALSNLIKTCELAGIEIEDWAVSVLAASELLLTQEQKELGVMLLDLGAGTSDFAVFEEGHVLDVGSFPIGGSHITRDLAIGFRTPVAVAEEVKVRYAQAMTDRSGFKREHIMLSEFISGNKDVFAARDLVDIVAARLSDIFELTIKALKKIGRAGLLPGGVVLAGGVADIPGIQDVARRELKLPVEIAKAIRSEVLNEVLPSRLAVPIGLAIWPGAQGSRALGGGGRAWPRVLEALKRMLRAFVP